MSDSSPISTLNQVPVEFLTSSGNRLEGKIHAAKNASLTRQNGELKKVAREFESIFIAQMLKVMRETIEESGLMEGGFGKSIYTEMFDQEVSLSLAKRGTLGIANLLEKRLSSVAPTDESEDSKKSSVTGSSNPPVEALPGNSGEDNSPEEEISDLQLPVHAPISSYFGMRNDPFSGQARFHKGLDLAAPEGMSVVPAMAGTVISAGYEKGYGNTVLVQHSGGLKTRYAHLHSINVNVGDTISSQNVLGTVGSTGRSTGSHLHFEVIRDGTPVNPTESIALHRSCSAVRSDGLKNGS